MIHNREQSWKLDLAIYFVLVPAGTETIYIKFEEIFRITSLFVETLVKNGGDVLT